MAVESPWLDEIWAGLARNAHVACSHGRSLELIAMLAELPRRAEGASALPPPVPGTQQGDEGPAVVVGVATVAGRPVCGLDHVAEPLRNLAHTSARLLASDQRCRCGHDQLAHQHYRRGSECSVCTECLHYRSARRAFGRLPRLLKGKS